MAGKHCLAAIVLALSSTEAREKLRPLKPTFKGIEEEAPMVTAYKKVNPEPKVEGCESMVVVGNTQSPTVGAGSC